MSNKNKNMCVTNTHDSMEAQDILKLVESIENEKMEAQNQKKETQQTDKEKELLYRCKAKYV